MIIIGLTGANASGKGEAAEYLKSKDFVYHSLSDILREEARVKGIEPSRENLIILGNKLRREKGPSILAELAIKKIKDKRNYIIDSIRNPFEIKALRQLKGFALVGIDAPLETRFNRILSRNRAGDPKTLEDFIEKERKENISADTNQQLKNCLKLADKIIINDSTIEKLHRKIDMIIERHCEEA